jgi:DNA-binding MarR family transcriptional regulator
MASGRPTTHARGVDLDDAAEALLAARIGASWKELRRGASMSALRDRLFGAGADALEPGQVDTLELLAAHDAWRMSELADALRVDPSTATRAVQRLVKAGLAQRRSSRSDGRVVMVSVTEAGRDRLDRISEVRRVTMSLMLAAFTRGEREQFADLMERFVSALDCVVKHLDVQHPAGGAST